MSEVYAEPWGFAAGGVARITVGSETYSLEPLVLRTYNSSELAGASLRLNPGMELAGSALKLAGDLSKVKRGRKMTQTLLATVKAAGGRVSFA